jgi:diguanylate cyclase (GGDEF)-like protein
MDLHLGLEEMLAAAADRLPTLPGVAVRILEAIQREPPEVREVGAILSADPALSAEVLKLVNSSLYGLPRPITGVGHAVAFLGLNTVTNLALGFAIIRTCRAREGGAFDYPGFWKHSLLTALAAKELGTCLKVEDPEDDFFRGLLHDIGILALVRLWPAPYACVQATMRQEACADYEAEARVLGFDHMAVGGHLAGRWNLPPAFSIPIAHHHRPHRLPAEAQPHATATRILFLAATAARLLEAPDPAPALRSLEETLAGWQWSDRVAVEEVVAGVSRQAREILPMFDLELDLEAHLALIEEARQVLARQATRTLAQVQDQRREIDRLSQRINRDGMTQLLNHTFFQDLLAQEMARSRGAQKPMVLILGDIDHFKAVNDTHGHPTGDRVIQAVADCLRSNLRENDHIARYGGEEFAIVLLDTLVPRARDVVERLRRAVAALACPAGTRSVGITMSFGLAIYRGEAELGPLALLERADNALYRAKSDGRNCARVYTVTPD